jgi:hypothetical protein
MPDKDGNLTGSDRRNMRIVLDRIIPAVDGLPGAGSMGLLETVEEMAAGHGRFRTALVRFLDALSLDMEVEAAGGFTALSEERQVEAIREIESSLTREFNHMLEAVYLAYYSDPRVHQRIGWRTGPLQPHGFQLAKFDASVLEKVRQREPFWRKV